MESLHTIGVPTLLEDTGYSGILDGYATVSLAFSTRRLRGAYTGDCCLLREDSGDTTRAFGFDSDGDLDAAAIAAWIAGAGATNAYLHTLYDQSGGGNDATQATTTKQPLYVPVGIGSKPTFRFDADDFLATAAVDMTAYNKATALHVVNLTAGAADRMILEQSTNAVSNGGVFALMQADETLVGYTKSAAGGANANWVSSDSAADADKALTLLFDMSLATNEVTGWIQGASNTGSRLNGNNTGTYPNAAFYIGARAGTGTFMVGDLAELILIPDALTTAQRQAIEADQSTEYSLGF